MRTFDSRLPLWFQSASFIRMGTLVMALIATLPAYGQSALDALQVPITDGAVSRIAIDDSGRIMMGGEFTVAGSGRALMMRSLPDGRRDTTFGLDFVPSDGRVRDFVQVPGAGYLVGGDFSGAGYNANLSLLNPNGSPVPGFNINIDWPVQVIERTSDDPDTTQYYIGGVFTSVAGATRHKIARLNNNRNLDLSFQPPPFVNRIDAIHPLPDSKILVGGFSLHIPGAPEAGAAIFRLNSDGSLDNSFVFDALTPGEGVVKSIAVQNDGRIVIAGQLTAAADGESRNHIVRLMPDGSLDPSFEPSSVPNGSVNEMALQPDGRIVVVGSFTNLGLSNYIARLNADGSVDTPFSLLMNPDVMPYTLAIQGDGGVLFAGEFTEINGQPVNRVARVRKDLGLDAGLDGSASGSTNGRVYSAGIDTSGNLFIGGNFTVVQGQTRTYLARLAGNSGTVNANFNPSLDGPVHAVLVQADGKVVIGGEFTLVNSVQRLRLARLNTDGSLDTSFNPVLLGNGAVYALAQAPDGKIYFGGSFDDAGGSGRDHFARLNTDGSLDTDFNDTGVDNTVRAITLDWDQYRVFIAGDFSMVGDYYRPRLARVWPHGTINNGFNAGNLGSSRISLAPMPDGGVLSGVGGGSSGIQRWLQDGTQDPDFDTGTVNGTVNSIVRDRLGRVYIGGGFTQVDGTSRQRLARLWADGSIDFDFADTPISFGVVPAPATVHSMLLQGNGKLVVAGEFSQVGDQVRRNIARISHRSGVPTERLVEGDSSVAWTRVHHGPEVRSAPQLLMSTTCCSPGDFEPLSGAMIWDSDSAGWVYEDFPGLDGLYYLKTRARIGGTGGGVMESPIHEFYGGPAPEDEADLGIEIGVDPPVANMGGTVTFQMAVTNMGPDPAAQVVVEALLPSGFIYQNHDTSEGSYDPVTGLWTIGGMTPKGPAGEVLMKIDATVAASGPYEFQVKVQSDVFDPFSGNNIASVEVTLLPPDDSLFADRFEQP